MSRFQLYMLLIPIWYIVSYLGTGWESRLSTGVASCMAFLAGVSLWEEGGR